MTTIAILIFVGIAAVFIVVGIRQRIRWGRQSPMSNRPRRLRPTGAYGASTGWYGGFGAGDSGGGCGGFDGGGGGGGDGGSCG